ncbi:MAG: hypothetical protein PHT33_10180 [bacterium]|nr:hypothetical protein [bacterium]
MMDSLIFSCAAWSYLSHPYENLNVGFAVTGLGITIGSLLSWFIIGIIYAYIYKVNKLGKRELLIGIIGETHGILGCIIAIIFFAEPDYLSIMAMFPWYMNYYGVIIFLRYIIGHDISLDLWGDLAIYITTLILMLMIFMAGVLIGARARRACCE